MKKISIIAMLSLLISLTILTNKTQPVCALDLENAKLVCTAKKVTKDERDIYLLTSDMNPSFNLLPNESIYNESIGTIKMNKAVRILHPKSNYLAFCFDFEEEFNLSKSAQYNDVSASLFINFFNYETLQPIFNYQLNKIPLDTFFSHSSKQITIKKISKFLLIKIDCSSFPDKFVIGPVLNKPSFTLILDEQNRIGKIKQAMLIDSNIELFPYQGFFPHEFGSYACMNKLTAVENTFPLNIDITNPLSLSKILEFIHPFDQNDGELKIVVIEDGYSYAAKNKIAGSYSVKLKATNSSNKTSYLELKITLRDTLKPIINGPVGISFSYINGEDSTTILRRFDVTDNSGKVTVTLDDSGVLYNRVGTYYATISATDSSQNISSRPVVITVFDDVPPEFIGPSIINVDSKNLQSLEELLSHNIYVVDEIDMHLPYKIIYDEYSSSIPKSGSYKVVLQATDSSGNSQSTTIYINVYNSNPIWYIDDISLTATCDTFLSAIDIVNLLKQQDKIENLVYTEADFLNHTYESNHDKPGIYETTIQAKANDNRQLIFNVAINVIEREVESIQTSNRSFFEELWMNIQSFFSSFFEKLIDFLSNFN